MSTYSNEKVIQFYKEHFKDKINMEEILKDFSEFLKKCPDSVQKNQEKVDCLFIGFIHGAAVMFDDLAAVAFTQGRTFAMYTH